jgi:hypothetical protein
MAESTSYRIPVKRATAGQNRSGWAMDHAHTAAYSSGALAGAGIGSPSERTNAAIRERAIRSCEGDHTGAPDVNSVMPVG